MLGDIGVVFVDVNDWSWNANPWVRGTCQYGVMPCNGLLYAPPDSCACRPEMRLHGFTAMAPSPDKAPADKPAASPHEKGPAFGQIGNRQSAIDDSADWPTYRHDGARSGRTKAAVPAALRQVWRTKIGPKLTLLIDQVYPMSTSQRPCVIWQCGTCEERS